MKIRIVLTAILVWTFSTQTNAQICIDCDLSTAHNATFGLEACMPFDGNADDETGNNTSIDLAGATLAFGYDGKQNSAYSFDGNDYIFLDELYDYDKRSVSVWFKVDRLTGNYQNIYVSDDPSLTNGLTALSIKNGASPILSFLVGGTSHYDVPINLGEWYHAVVTVDGSTVKYYLNGSLVQNETNNNFNSVSGIGSAVLGGSRDTSTYWFHGIIDNFRIYSGVLDSAAIDSLYNMNCCPDCSNTCFDCTPSRPTNAAIAACYSLDANANDGSGNGNDGTLNGPVQVTNRFGTANSAYRFDGSNDYITIDDQFDSSIRSYSVWFRLTDFPSSLQDVFVSDGPNLNNGLTAIAVKSSGNVPQVQFLVGNNADLTLPIQLYKWHHAAITVNNTDVTFYLNGEEFSGYTNNNFSSVDGLNKTVIGSARDATTYWFKGDIDDVKVFNRTLSATDVNKLVADFCDTSSNTGIQNVQNQIMAYPNPGNGHVNLDFNSTLENGSLTVYNSAGKLISVGAVRGKSHELDLSSHSNGVYFITVMDSNGIRYRTKYIKH